MVKGVEQTLPPYKEMYWCKGTMDVTYVTSHGVFPKPYKEAGNSNLSLLMSTLSSQMRLGPVSAKETRRTSDSLGRREQEAFVHWVDAALMVAFGHVCHTFKLEVPTPMVTGLHCVHVG